MAENDRQCWFWNIDLDNQEYIAAQLKEGKLRQRWGSKPFLNLKKLKAKPETERNEEEQDTWERCKPMLENIKINDLIVVKNVPDRSHFTLVKVTGEYDFQIDKAIGDFGHFLPIEVVGDFDKYRSAAVPAKFVRALNAHRHPIRRTSAHKQTVIDLALSVGTEEGKEKEIEEEQSATVLSSFWKRVVIHWEVAATIVALIEFISAIIGIVADFPDFMAVVNKFL
jgi:hypothetical protein